MTFHWKETEHMTALLVGTSVNRCVRLPGWPACFVHLLSRLGGEGQSEKASKMQGKCLLDQRWEWYIHTNAATQTQQTESWCVHSIQYFNNLLFMSHLDKNSCKAKTHKRTYGMSGETTAAAETPQHLVFEPGMIVTAYVCVCVCVLCIYTQRHTLNPHRSQFTLTQSPHTVHLQSAQKSPH